MGIPKIRIVIRVPILALVTPESTQESIAPSAIIAAIHAN
jgi:hypothetical protein